MDAAERAALALRIFEWAVVRQSDIGPGLTTCCNALGVTRKSACVAIAAWADPRGHMALVLSPPAAGGLRTYRIEAYYNTSG